MNSQHPSNPFGLVLAVGSVVSMIAGGAILAGYPIVGEFVAITFVVLGGRYAFRIAEHAEAASRASNVVRVTFAQPSTELGQLDLEAEPFYAEGWDPRTIEAGKRRAAPGRIE